VTLAAAVLDDDPIWLVAIKAVAIFTLLLLMTLFMIWFERRVVGRMQHRPGPNRVGPFGLLQSLADGLKLIFKEDIRPFLADKWVYILAPIIAGIPGFIAFAVIPLGPEVSIFGERTLLQLADVPIGVLVVLAAASVGVYGIVLSGWSSGSPYPLLGSLRSAAQVISYEIAMGLAIVSVVLLSGSLSTTDIVAGQEKLWFAILTAPGLVIYVIAMVGETNRAPFDLPEAESELVGGFHTEYSSMKFGLFFLAEYVNMITVSAFATTLFLGGWRAPCRRGPGRAPACRQPRPTASRSHPSSPWPASSRPARRSGPAGAGSRDPCQLGQRRRAERRRRSNAGRRQGSQRRRFRRFGRCPTSAWRGWSGS